jgi:phage tail-like protein
VQVSNLKAEADPRGGRVNLSWVTPPKSDFPDFRGVKVLRREGTYPDAQQLAAELGVYDDSQTAAGQPAAFNDTGLKGETVYYYAVAAYDGGHPATYFVSYVSALSTTSYGTGERLYEGLPDQYQRFDNILPPDAPQLAPEDLQKGQLRRLVEMFGLQFDLLRSYASGMGNFYDVERIDGALLPLLAQWLGWQTDFSLPVVKQRNEIRYAPHFYRTTGIAANLKATLNRLTTWDAQIKEFAHNVLRANDPEKLTIRESTRRGGIWDRSRQTTTDWSFEGRPAIVKESEEQQWLFYHTRHEGRAARPEEHDARQQEHDASRPVETGPIDYSHVWFKLCNFGEWLPAQRLTSGNSINRAPSAVRRKADGSFLVFYNTLESDGFGGYASRLKLSLLAAGHPFQHARLKGTGTAPFALAEGDELTVTVTSGGNALPRTITFFREDFRDITQATAPEVAAFLDREMAGVSVTAAEDGTILLTSLADVEGVTVEVSGTAANKLGLPLSGASAAATSAQLLGNNVEPFPLADGDTLVVKVDGGLPRTVTFHQRQFNDITRATVAEIVTVLKTYLPRSALATGGRLKLLSPNAGASSSVVVDINASTAAPKLGFGVPPPPAVPSQSDSEPAAFEDKTGGLWLFWSMRGSGATQIFYNRFDGAAWGAARALTVGPVAAREPFVLYDPTPGGLLWVFWSGRKADGRWNVCYRTTANLDFSTHTDADWHERELTVDPQAAYNNREPAAFLLDAGSAELYFTSNRSDGQNIWTTVLTPASQQAETQVTKGQFTQRAPAVAGFDNHVVRLWFRTNESLVYTSGLYPSAQTTDARYSGSTTLDTRNPAKFGIRGQLGDVVHYTYDTAKGNDNWYARDTVGIYLTPDTNDEALIIRKRNQIESLLRRFLPMQVRGVIIVQQVFPENVYNYDFPNASPPLRIRETMIDAVIGEVNKWPQADAYTDALDFHRFHLWDNAHTGDRMPDTTHTPLDLSARLYWKRFDKGD